MFQLSREYKQIPLKANEFQKVCEGCFSSGIYEIDIKDGTVIFA